MHGRRTFLGRLVAAAAAIFGLPRTTAAKEPKSVGWLLEDIQRFANEHVWMLHFSHVSCGAGTCPPGPIAEGFRAIITTPQHFYTIIVKPTYLGCGVSNIKPDPGEDWLRGSDLADGAPTRGTWERIKADIVRVERTGSKYKG